MQNVWRMTRCGKHDTSWLAACISGRGFIGFYYYLSCIETEWIAILKRDGFPEIAWRKTYFPTCSERDSNQYVENRKDIYT